MNKIKTEDFLKLSEKEKRDEKNAEKAKAEDEKKALKEEIIAKLIELQKKYDDSDRETFKGNAVKKLVLKEDDTPSDEELLSIARQTYAPAADVKKRELVFGTDKKKDDFASKIAKIEASAKQNEENINKTYENAKEEAVNAAVKRGVGRSSIVSGKIDEIENEKNKKIASASFEKDGRIAEINADIANAEEELRLALEKLDDETARKVAEKLTTLTEKRKKERESIEKYNAGQIKEREEKLAQLQRKGITTAETKSDEYIEMFGDKFRTLYRYYYPMGKDARNEIISDREMIEKYYGERGYNLLLSFFKEENR